MFNYNKEGKDSGETGKESEEMKEKECGQPQLYQGQGESNEVLNHKKKKMAQVVLGKSQWGRRTWMQTPRGEPRLQFTSTVQICL